MNDRFSDPSPCPHLERPFRFSITPPGSKSLTNRALLLSALAEGRSVLRRPLRAVDTEVMVGALRDLVDGNRIEIHESCDGEWDTMAIDGTGGRFEVQDPSTLRLENAGTATRFLAAACTLANQPVTIDGNSRMRERPIGELVESLREIGATIEYLDREGFVPLRVHPSILKGGWLSIGETLSSQYISAIFQIAPFCENGLTVEFTGRTRSPSYIAMTLGLMERFGARIEVEGTLEKVNVEPGRYHAVEYDIEPDASSATYFLAAAAVCPGAVCTIDGLGGRSLQGDTGFADVMRQMGAGLTYGDDFTTIIGPRNQNDAQDSFGTPDLHGIDIDMNHMPDAAMTLAVVALFAQGETVIRGLGNLRHKETDRLAALQTELSKFGAHVEIEDHEVFVVEPPAFDDLMSNTKTIAVDTYNDHRMAMAFAVAGLRVPNVVINDPMCVRKTYPRFWDDWHRLTTGS